MSCIDFCTRDLKCKDDVTLLVRSGSHGRQCRWEQAAAGWDVNQQLMTAKVGTARQLAVLPTIPRMAQPSHGPAVLPAGRGARGQSYSHLMLSLYSAMLTDHFPVAQLGRRVWNSGRKYGETDDDDDKEMRVGV